VIAGYAVVGEREQGTLEPVLTTPVRREEIVVGKALAAIAPSTAMAYVLFTLFVVVVRLFSDRHVVSLVWQPAVVITIALFTPLLAAFSIWVGIAISARSSDVRAAQQLASLAIPPMIGVLWLFAFRVIAPTVTVAVVGAVVLAVLDLGAWRIVSAVFDRERLLTRYGRS
jgi:ABC-2 type transport system permease protein